MEELEDLECNNLKIWQDKKLYTFTSDAVILANFIKLKASETAVEIGGGSGVISVLANVLPKETHDIVEKYLSGDVVESRKLQLSVNELVSSLFIEVNPIPVKAAMNLMGMEAGDLRLPLTDISKQNLEILRSNMIKYGIEVE